MERRKAHSTKGRKGSKTKKKLELPPPGALEAEWKAFNDPELTRRETEFVLGDTVARLDNEKIKPRYLDLGIPFEDDMRGIVLAPGAVKAWKVDEKEPDEVADDRFRDYVYGLLESEGRTRYRKETDEKSASGPSISRQARDLERSAKEYEQQAKKDPANADKWRARAADRRQAREWALKTSPVLRDPLKDGSDRRHTISDADRILLDLLNDVTRATGKLPFKVLAPLRKALGLPYDTRKSLSAFASRYSPPKPRS